MISGHNDEPLILYKELKDKLTRLTNYVVGNK